MSLEVRWRSGKTSVVAGVRANREYEINEAAATATKPESFSSTNPLPLFRDVSNRVPIVHHEVPFDDYERQPLLPKKLSQPGPAVAWFDINGDGVEDLIMGSGRGG